MSDAFTTEDMYEEMKRDAYEDMRHDSQYDIDMLDVDSAIGNVLDKNVLEAIDVIEEALKTINMYGHNLTYEDIR